MNRVQVPQFIPLDTAGRPVANGYVYVGVPDTDPTVLANQKTLYIQQENGTITSVSQPIRTNAGGVPIYNGDPVTLLIDGDYSLRISNSSGSQIYYIPNVTYDEVIEPGSYYYPSSSASDQGITGSNNTIKYYVDTIGATNKATIFLKHDSGNATTPYTFTTAETIPANIIIEFEPGAYITGTVAFAGLPDAQIKALPLQKIFTSASTVTFGKTGTVYSTWWEENTTPATTDMVTAIKAAYGSITGGVVKVIGRQKFTAALTIPAGVTIQGDGAADATPAFCPVRPSGLVKSGNFTGVTLSRNSVLKDISIDGEAGNGGDGILFAGRGILENVGVFAQGDDGVVVGDGVGDQNFSSLYNVISGWNGGKGFVFGSAIYNANAIGGFNCFAWNNTGHGFEIGKAWSIVLMSTYSESNGGTDYKFLDGALGNTLISPRSDSATGTLVFDAGSYNNTVIGNKYGLTGQTLTITDNGFNTFGAYSSSGSELVEDGSGDSTDGWTANVNASLSVSGGYLVLTRTGGTDQAIFSTLDETKIIVGRVYKFTGKVKSGTSGNEGFIAQVYINGDTPGFVTGASASGTSSGTDQTWSFTWKATAANISIYLIKNSATAGTMLWDDISVKEVAVASDGDSWVNGDIWSAVAGKGVILRNAAGTVIKRVRLNDAGDGLLYETP